MRAARRAGIVDRIRREQTELPIRIIPIGSTSMTEPLKAHWFQILLALAAEDRHGSGIMRAVLEQTGGTLRLWPVMLYNSLEQMTEAGLIQEIGGHDRPAESERRRYYRITRAGKRALADDAERMASLAKAARAQLSARRGDA
jgi:DNA-binding PadR family transcriptional regulator